MGFRSSDCGVQKVFRLVWNDLKLYLAMVVKPTTKRQLIEGVLHFWHNIVTVEYCNSKIDHLPRVLLKIIDLKGKATGL